MMKKVDIKRIQVANKIRRIISENSPLFQRAIKDGKLAYGRTGLQHKSFVEALHK